jgi:hypothetical protein
MDHTDESSQISKPKRQAAYRGSAKFNALWGELHLQVLRYGDHLVDPDRRLVRSFCFVA